jgi:hypothetical protein
MMAFYGTVPLCLKELTFESPMSSREAYRVDQMTQLGLLRRLRQQIRLGPLLSDG